MGLLFKVIILVVLVAAGVYFTLDYIVEFGLELYGSWTMGTRVSVSSVDIDLINGKGTMKELAVSDPAGFSKGDALNIKTVDFQFDLQSLTRNPLVIERVIVDGPEVKYAENDSGTSNVNVITNNLDQFLNKQLEKPQTDSKRKTMVIRKFTVKNGTLAIKLGNKSGKLQIVRLPSVTLSNVGGRDGSSLARLGKTIASTFSQAIIKTASGRGLESYLEIVFEDKVLNKAKDFVRRVF